ACLAERHADGLSLQDQSKFRAYRFQRLGSDDPQRIAERQAGFDAADDDVDGVGEPVDELRLAPFFEIRQDPARQAEAGGEAEQHRGDRADIEEVRPRKYDDTERGADDDELPLR